MGESVDAAVFAEAEDLTFGAQVATRSIEEDVVFEGARRFEMEAELRQAGLKGFEVGDRKLQFDFGSLHGGSIRKAFGAKRGL